jgi:site-specific recombinase XerD
MKKQNSIAGPVQGFFAHYLTAQRGLSGHTVLAYRDAMKLFLGFISEQSRKRCADLTVEDITRNTVLKFLDHLERVRKNGVRTRNVRLAAIHSFFHYLSVSDPRYLEQCRGVLSVPFKREYHRVPEYLERDEVLRIFGAIDRREPLGLRDDAILRLLYNTGMRASELVDLNVNHVRFSRPNDVRIHGKGHKERTCPLWKETVQALKQYVEQRSVRLTDACPLFVNSQGARLTRFGLRHIISHRIEVAGQTCATLLTRRVTPHTFRHTTAMHLLQAGTEINMIRSWLGHSSIETTHEYAEIDLEMKRKTLQSCEKLLPKSGKHEPLWKRDKDVLEWLSKL